jgi:hypothetical protein
MFQEIHIVYIHRFSQSIIILTKGKNESQYNLVKTSESFLSLSYFNLN